MLSTVDASHLYHHVYLDGLLHRITAFFRKCQHRLLDLSSITTSRRIDTRHYTGTQSVPIRQIQGSEGRTDDFDNAFRPLQEHTEGRWVRVADAYLRGDSLPPVELIRVGDIYYVRDGHHRISVAAALGQQEIEAVVTVWKVDHTSLRDARTTTACTGNAVRLVQSGM